VVNKQIFAKTIWSHLLAQIPLVVFIIDLIYQPFFANTGERIIHFTGQTTMQLLLATISVSWIATRIKFGLLIRWRRPLGLWTFCYALLHLTAFLIFETGLSWLEIQKSFIELQYVWFGSIAFVIFLLLALTSNRYAYQKLKHNWQRLHNLVYLAGLLAMIHLILLIKSSYQDAVVYGLLFVLIMTVKMLTKWQTKSN